MAGLAQKGGPVTTHLRIAAREDDLHATRISSGEAAVLIGCDLVVSSSPETIFKLRPGFTRAIVNNDFSITSEFVRAFAAQATTGDLAAHPDPVFQQAAMEKVIADACGEDARGQEACRQGWADFLEAARLATALLGDSIATNPFLLGYAYQKGVLPVAAASIIAAIENRGIAVEQNRKAFFWGRRAAHDLAATEKAAGSPARPRPYAKRPLQETIDGLSRELTAYRNRAYAERFKARVAQIRAAETRIAAGGEALTRAFALGYYKLLAFKDEYEIARLYSRPEFLSELQAQFEGDYSLTFHFAPPSLDGLSGGALEPRKRKFGSWTFGALRLLAALKFLRGSWLDPFRFSPDRRFERQLIQDYEDMADDLVRKLNADNLPLAVELAALPQQIRGYGPVKARYAASAKKREAVLKRRFAEASLKF